MCSQKLVEDPLEPDNFPVSQESRRQTTPSRKTGVEAKRPSAFIPICFLLYILSTKYAILIRSGKKKKKKKQTFHH